MERVCNTPVSRRTTLESVSERGEVLFSIGEEISREGKETLASV
jgi:hypothetical protein